MSSRPFLYFFASKPVVQHSSIFQVDCSLVGAAGGELPSLGFVREAVSMLMLRYPSRLGNLFIVNSGMVVYYLWQAISRLLPPVRN